MTTPARDAVAAVLHDALARAAAKNGWQGTETVAIDPEIPATAAHGDYATSVAMRLARQLREPPRDIANAIKAEVVLGEPIASADVAGGGFVNVRLADRWLRAQIDAIVADGTAYGRSDALRGKRIQVEFVSANPTGPVTFANARGGPLGDVLASVLSFAGAVVQREYYVEDTGTQFENFGLSIAARYRQLLGDDVALPDEGYQGEYIVDIAREIHARDGDRHRGLDLAEQAKIFAPIGVEWVVRDAKRVTEKLGIRFDEWFSQAEMMRSGYFEKTLEELRQIGKVYEKDGAVWYRAPEGTEDKEGWVLVRSNGEPGYLGKDIAYHRLCIVERGLDLKLDIWGANTHYHLLQMRDAMSALGLAEKFEVVLYQFVRFLHEGEILGMSRRKGEFITLKDVLDRVGKDVTRFFLLQRGADSPLDFDLELAVQQSNENPVYYVQYAHARIASIFRTAAERGLTPDGADLSVLQSPGDLAMVRLCLKLPELLGDIVQHRGAHLLTVYALELAGAFHGFYRDHRVVGDDVALSKARLRLVQAIQVTLRQTLDLLGVSAPESM